MFESKCRGDALRLIMELLDKGKQFELEQFLKRLKRHCGLSTQLAVECKRVVETVLDDGVPQATDRRAYAEGVDVVNMGDNLTPDFWGEDDW